MKPKSILALTFLLTTALGMIMAISSPMINQGGYATLLDENILTDQSNLGGLLLPNETDNGQTNPKGTDQEEQIQQQNSKFKFNTDIGQVENMSGVGHILGTKSIGNAEITYRLGERVKIRTPQPTDNFLFARSKCGSDEALIGGGWTSTDFRPGRIQVSFSGPGNSVTSSPIDTWVVAFSGMSGVQVQAYALCLKFSG